MNNLKPHLATANIPADAYKPYRCNGDFQIVDYGTGELLEERCEADTFEQLYQYKTYRGMITSGQLSIMAIPVIRCTKCGKVTPLDDKLI